MKKKTRDHFYLAPPQAIKEKIQSQVAASSFHSYWKFALPVLATCLVIAIYITKDSYAPRMEESYVESFFMVEDLLDEGLDDFVSSTEQDTSEHESDLLETLI